MPTPLRTRLTDLTNTILGRERTGDSTPPQTGTDPSSKRHLLALILGTLAIMTVGLIVAFTQDESSEGTVTPTVVASPSAGHVRTDAVHGSLYLA